MLDLSEIAAKENIIHEFVIKNATRENKKFNFFGDEDKSLLNVENPILTEDENYFQELSPNQIYERKYSLSNSTKNIDYPWVSDPNFKTNEEVIINLTNPYFSIREKMLIYNKHNSVSSLWIKNIVQDQDESRVYPDYEISSSFYMPEANSFGASRIRKSTNSMFPGSLALFFYSIMKKKMNKELKTIGKIADSCPLSNFSKLFYCTKENYKELDKVLSEMEQIIVGIKSSTINVLLPSLFLFSQENLSLKLQIPKEIFHKQMTIINPEKLYYRINKVNDGYIDYISKYYINDQNIEVRYAYPRYIHLYKDGTTKCFYLAGKKENGKAKFVDREEFLNSGINHAIKEMALSIDVNAAMKKHLEVLDRNEQNGYIKLKELFPKFGDIIKKIVVDSYKEQLLINSL